MKSSKGLFDKRTGYYKKTDRFDDLKHFDNWEKAPFLYCKQNKQRRAIAPLEVSGLKLFHSTNKVSALNFVVDAFESMARFYNREIFKGTINGLTGVKELTPRKGYMKAIALYRNHTETLKTLFINDYLIPNRKSINTFGDFMKKFFEFIEREAALTPITYSSFVLSSLCPIHCTGLVVETLSSNHNINSPKYKRLYDINYDFYSNMAIGFGFVVPRHAPWMFIANLSSSKMHEYIKQHNVARPNQDKVLHEYFYECKDYDIDLLRQMIYDTYYEFFNLLPIRTDLSLCDDVLLVKNSNAVLDDLAQINGSFRPFDWLTIYLKVLAAERGIMPVKTRLESFLGECRHLYTLYGFDMALEFAEMKLLKKKTNRFR